MDCKECKDITWYNIIFKYKSIHLYMTKSISYVCNVNKQQMVCVCVFVHIETKLYKQVIKLSNHDHCNKLSFNDKKPRRFTWKPLRSTVAEGGRCVDPNVQSSIQVSPSTLLKFSIHEDFSCSISSCSNGPKPVRIHQRFKKPLKSMCGTFVSKIIQFIPYGIRYIYNIFQAALCIFKISLHMARLEKTTTKATQPPFTAMCLPKMICFFGGWNKISYCTSKMSMVANWSTNMYFTMETSKQLQ